MRGYFFYRYILENNVLKGEEELSSLLRMSDNCRNAFIIAKLGIKVPNSPEISESYIRGAVCSLEGAALAGRAADIIVDKKLHIRAFVALWQAARRRCC